MEYTGLCVLAAFVLLFVAIAWARISHEMGEGIFFSERPSQCVEEHSFSLYYYDHWIFLFVFIIDLQY